MTLAHTNCTPQAPTRKSLPKLVMTWVGLRRQRRALASLDARQLDDIGVTESEARSEAKRAAWDVPSHWRW